MTTSLVSILRQFNRKERHWLLMNALGEQATDVPLSKSFRDFLEAAIGVAIPETSWWSIDYHVDWLFCALVIDAFDEGKVPKIFEKQMPSQGPRDPPEHHWNSRRFRPYCSF